MPTVVCGAALQIVLCAFAVSRGLIGSKVSTVGASKLHYVIVYKEYTAQKRLFLLSCADKRGHEMSVTTLVRMATHRAQRGDCSVLQSMQLLLLLLLLGGSLFTCYAGAETVPFQAETTVDTAEEASGAPSTSSATSSEAGHGPSGALTGAFRENLSRINTDAEDKENLALLHTAIIAADATEIEQPTDSRFFLGVISQRIRRHLLVDVVSMLALLAGYYLVASGLEQKAEQKPATKSLKT